MSILKKVLTSQGDRQVIESMEWKCFCVGGIEDVMDMYEELLEEYIAKKAV